MKGAGPGDELRSSISPAVRMPGNRGAADDATLALISPIQQDAAGWRWMALVWRLFQQPLRGKWIHRGLGVDTFKGNVDKNAISSTDHRVAGA